MKKITAKHKSRNYLLGFGTALAVIVPSISVVACGNKSDGSDKSNGREQFYFDTYMKDATWRPYKGFDVLPSDVLYGVMNSRKNGIITNVSRLENYFSGGLLLGGQTSDDAQQELANKVIDQSVFGIDQNNPQSLQIANGSVTTNAVQEWTIKKDDVIASSAAFDNVSDQLIAFIKKNPNNQYAAYAYAVDATTFKFCLFQVNSASAALKTGVDFFQSTFKPNMARLKDWRSAYILAPPIRYQAFNDEDKTKPTSFFDKSAGSVNGLLGDAKKMSVANGNTHGDRSSTDSLDSNYGFKANKSDAQVKTALQDFEFAISYNKDQKTDVLYLVVNVYHKLPSKMVDFQTLYIKASETNGFMDDSSFDFDKFSSVLNDDHLNASGLWKSMGTIFNMLNLLDMMNGFEARTEAMDMIEYMRTGVQCATLLKDKTFLSEVVAFIKKTQPEFSLATMQSVYEVVKGEDFSGVPTPINHMQIYFAGTFFRYLNGFLNNLKNTNASKYAQYSSQFKHADTIEDFQAQQNQP